MLKRSLLFTILLTLSISAFCAPVALSDSEMVNLTQELMLKDDVVVIVSAPVFIYRGKTRVAISEDIRKLRRSDNIIYDSDKDGSVATRCLVIMLVPKENVAELIARIDADDSLSVVSASDEMAVFPEIENMKDRALSVISTEGK